MNRADVSRVTELRHLGMTTLFKSAGEGLFDQDCYFVNSNK